MRKLVTLMATLAVAFALAIPASAKHNKSKKESASTTETGNAHAKHAKKKGATEGKKKGQEGANPGKSN